MKENLKTLIDDAALRLCGKHSVSPPDALDYDLHPPKDASHGDFACNIAFKLARNLRQKPADVAAALQKELLGQEQKNFIESVEIAGAGFINFKLKKDALGSLLLDIHKADKKYGCVDEGKGRKVLLEFVSANPTGPLTIAHGRQAAIGDALHRILNFAGFKAEAEYYLNDAGRQIRLLGESVFSRYAELFQIEKPFPEDGYRGEYIREVAAALVEQKKDKLLKLKDAEAASECGFFAKQFILNGIHGDLEAMRVNFDSFFSETSLYDKKLVEKALELLKKKHFLYESDGALWFRSTDFGDDKDRVVKKSDGDYTYLAPDIAYHLTKLERGYEELVNLWGPDHHGYIPRLRAACAALGHDKEKVRVGIVQLTTLYRQGEPVRMSTRAGEFVTLRELMNEVGVDATRFFFIMRRQESHLDFDLDLAKEKSQDNPVYYLQYAHARIASILRFAERKVTKKANLSLLSSQHEAELIGILTKFPDNVRHAAVWLEPYRLVDYLRTLSASFHRFYNQHRVVTEDASLTDARLLLCDAVRIVLRNGLELLGISQPESM